MKRVSEPREAHAKRLVVAVVMISIILIFVGLLNALVNPFDPEKNPVITQTWSGLSDLNNGTKVDTGASYFAQNGYDQPSFDFISHPAAMYDTVSQRTYFVWSSGIGSTICPGGCDGTAYRPSIIAYSSLTGTWSPPVVIASYKSQVDGHGAPIVFVASSGKVHVFCCSHDTRIYHFRSVNARDITSWTNLTSTSVDGTYPNVFEYGSKLVLMRRDQAPGSGSHFVYSNSTNDGSTWSANHILIDGEEYFGNFHVVGNLLHFSWVRFLVARYNVYACYMNLDTGIVFSYGGANLGASVSDSEADTSCRVRNSGATQTNQPAVSVFNGVPYVVWNEGNTINSVNVYFSMWNEAAWTAPVSITVIHDGTEYHDIQAISSSILEVFLTGKDFAHGCVGDCEFGGRIEQWLSLNGGATWVLWSVLMDHARTGGVGLNFPYIPLNAVPDVRLMFAEFGTTAACTCPNVQYNLHLYAWGDSGFVRNTGIASGPSSETITDNAQVATDSIVISNGKGDTFSTSIPGTNQDTEKWHWAQTDDGTGNCASTFTGSLVSHSYSSGGIGTKRRQCYTIGKFGISGDFDFRFKASNVAGPDNYIQLWLLSIYDEHVGNGADGNAPVVPNSNGMLLETAPTATGISFGFRVKNGSLDTSGSHDYVGTTVYDRITRVGYNWTAYHSATGSSWTTVHTASLPGVYGDVYVLVDAWMRSVTTSATMTIDDFNLVSGGLVNGYRTNGLWKTPTFSTPPGYRVSQVGWNGTTNAFNCMDKVDLRQGGMAQETWQTGCQAQTLTTNVTVGGSALDVMYRLAGNGSATPSLTNASVTNAVPPTSQTTLVELIVPFLLIFVAVVIAIDAIAVRRNR